MRMGLYSNALHFNASALPLSRGIINCLKHGLDGLKDYTDYIVRKSVKSLNPYNPCFRHFPPIAASHRLAAGRVGGFGDVVSAPLNDRVVRGG